MKSEMKLPRDRDREMKFLENFREILENQKIKKFENFGANDFHLANFYFYQKFKFIMTKCKVTCTICHMMVRTQIFLSYSFKGRQCLLGIAGFI